MVLVASDVGDFYGILVFDSNGAYLNTVDLGSGVAYGMTIDDQNNLPVVIRPPYHVE